MVQGLTEAQLQEEMMAALKPRGHQQHSRGARSASPLMRALEFNRSTDNLASAASMDSIPHEAKLVVHRVRQAVLRSGHSHEQVFHRFCRAGGGDALAPLMTWSDFLRVIETFERDLEPSVVVRLWQVLVPGGASGMDFNGFKKWFCQDDNALGITREIANLSFTNELNAFSRLMEPAPAAEWRPMAGRPPLSPLFAPGGRDPQSSPKRMSNTLPVPLKDAIAMEAEVARRAEEQRLVQQVSDAAQRVEEERAARRAAEAEVEALRRAEEQRREEERSRRHAEVEALQREAAQRQAQQAQQPQQALTPAPNSIVSQLPSATPHIPKLLPQNPLLPAPLPQSAPLPQQPLQQPAPLPQNPLLPQQPPQQPTALPQQPPAPLPQGPPPPQQPLQQQTALPQQPPAPFPQSPPLPQQPPQQQSQQPPMMPQSPPLPSQPQPLPPQQPPAPYLPQSPAPFAQTAPSLTSAPPMPLAPRPLAPAPLAPTPSSPPAPLAPTTSSPPAPLAPTPLAPFGSTQPALGGGSPAAPQSGQTAPLDASGFAGAVASGKDMDVQAFIGRYVNHLGCKVAAGKYSTLAQLAGEWAAQVKQYNCVANSIKPIFDNITTRIRQDSQTPGSWVTGTAAPPQPQLPFSPPLAPAPLAPKAPTPYAPLGSPPPAPLMPGVPPPLAPSSGTQPAPFAPLQPLGSVPPPTTGTSSPPTPLQPLGVGTKPAPLAPAPLQPLSSGTAPAPLAPTPLQPLGAPLAPFASTQPSTGSTSPSPPPLAPLQPLAPTTLGSPPAPLAPTPLAPFGSPQAPLGGGSSASPLSGQTAPLEAAGLAGVVAGGKDPDVQAFVGRLIHHLGCKIAPGKYATLAQLANEWATQVRQQNCVVDNVRSLYDNIVARIKQDSQTPGSWVSGLAPSTPQSPTMQPLAPLQPLTSGPPAPLAPLAGSTPAPLAPTPLQPLAPTPLSPTGPPAPLAPPSFGGPPAPLAPTPLGGPPAPLAPLAPPGAQANAPLGAAPATPLSGQTAPMDAGGFAGAVASGKDADVQAFVGRLVYHVGCKVAPGKFSTLSQLAGEWAAQVRGQNCVVSSSTPIYDSMVARIKQDAQTPGSWVTSSGSQQATSPQPAPLQPLSPPPGPLGPPPLSSSTPQPLSAPMMLAPPSAPLGSQAYLGSPPPGSSDVLTFGNEPPADKNLAAAQRKADLDAKMKARAAEAAERRARAKERADAIKAGNAPLA